jgi:hypothetical protein
MIADFKHGLDLLRPFFKYLTQALFFGFAGLVGFVVFGVVASMAVKVLAGETSLLPLLIAYICGIVVVSAAGIALYGHVNKSKPDLQGRLDLSRVS